MPQEHQVIPTTIMAFCPGDVLNGVVGVQSAIDCQPNRLMGSADKVESHKQGADRPWGLGGRLLRPLSQ